MPDASHLFKAIKSILLQNKVIYLPDEVVQSKKLPLNKFNIQHILDLVDAKAFKELKVAFRLQKEFRQKIIAFII